MFDASFLCLALAVFVSLTDFIYFQNGYARYFLYLLSPTHSFWLLVVFITRAPTWRPRNKRTKWLSSSLPESICSAY